MMIEPTAPDCHRCSGTGTAPIVAKIKGRALHLPETATGLVTCGCPAGMQVAARRRSLGAGSMAR